MTTTTRRSLLRGAARAATAAAVAGLVPSGAQAITSTDDAALLAAEAEFAFTFEHANAMPGDTSEEEDIRDAAVDDAYQIYDCISLARPASPAGVAVKLRLILDDAIGIESGLQKYDIRSLALVLAVIEGITGRPATARPTTQGEGDEEENDPAAGKGVQS